jgi:hypothetical protein
MRRLAGLGGVARVGGAAVLVIAALAGCESAGPRSAIGVEGVLALRVRGPSASERTIAATVDAADAALDRDPAVLALMRELHGGIATDLGRVDWSGDPEARAEALDAAPRDGFRLALRHAQRSPVEVRPTIEAFEVRVDVALRLVGDGEYVLASPGSGAAPDSELEALAAALGAGADAVRKAYLLALCERLLGEGWLVYPVEAWDQVPAHPEPEGREQHRQRVAQYVRDHRLSRRDGS